jgi:SAM-dependent methyltransferase
MDVSFFALLADPVDRAPLAWDAENQLLRNATTGRAWPVIGCIPALIEREEHRVVRYDGVASWYDAVMQDAKSRGPLRAAGFALLSELIGPGSGVALDVGCGTGLSSAPLRQLGYEPVGIDLSLDMLGHAQKRLPVAQADVAHLPLCNDRVPLAYSTFTTTDWDDHQAALREVYRVLKPGGRYVSVAVHPCFSGSHARFEADGSVIQNVSYFRTGYELPAAHTTSIRSRVGAWHRTLADLLNDFASVGFWINRIAEGGPRALPEILGIQVRKP